MVSIAGIILSSILGFLHACPAVYIVQRTLQYIQTSKLTILYLTNLY